MVQNILNDSVYDDLMSDQYHQPEENIISECHLSFKTNSFEQLQFQDSMQNLPFEQIPDNEKVLIPGKLPGDQPILVNAKQARRILIMRQKKYKKMLELMDQGVTADPRSLMTSITTKTRKKDEVRQRVALNRKRVNGLFVNKKKEMMLAQDPCSDYSDETETFEPD